MAKGGAQSAWRLLARAPEAPWQWPGLPLWGCLEPPIWAPRQSRHRRVRSLRRRPPCMRSLRSRALLKAYRLGREEGDLATPPRSRRPPRRHR